VQAIGNERTVFWTPQEKFYAKNTCNLPPSQKIPTIIDAKGEVVKDNDTLKKVFSFYEDNVKKIKETRKEYSTLIAQLEESIANISDAASANTFAQEMSKSEVIWDSKIRAREMFKARVEELHLHYNPAKKSYEDAAA